MQWENDWHRLLVALLLLMFDHGTTKICDADRNGILYRTSRKSALNYSSLRLSKNFYSRGESSVFCLLGWRFKLNLVPFSSDFAVSCKVVV